MQLTQRWQPGTTGRAIPLQPGYVVRVPFSQDGSRNYNYQDVLPASLKSLILRGNFNQPFATLPAGLTAASACAVAT